MVLDLLPYKTPGEPRKSWGRIRYAVFLSSLAFVSLFFLFRVPYKERIYVVEFSHRKYPTAKLPG